MIRRMGGAPVGAVLARLCGPLLTVAVAIGASGCAHKQATPQPVAMKSRARLTVELGVEIEKEANENFPVAVSMVFVYDKALVKDLADSTAAQWFEHREQYLRDHTETVHEELLEFVPGEPVDQLSRQIPATPVQGLLYARYRNPGVHRILFDPTLSIHLMLGRDRMLLRP